MTYLPPPENEDERLADSWWRSLSNEQQEDYRKIRASRVGLARLNANLRLAESDGCGFVVSIVVVFIVVAAIVAALAPAFLAFFGYGIDIYRN